MGSHSINQSINQSKEKSLKQWSSFFSIQIAEDDVNRADDRELVTPDENFREVK